MIDKSLSEMIDALGTALKSKESFNNDKNFPPPVYVGGGWLIPSWITPERLQEPEVITYLQNCGFLKKEHDHV